MAAKPLGRLLHSRQRSSLPAQRQACQCRLHAPERGSGNLQRKTAPAAEPTSGVAASGCELPLARLGAKDSSE